MQSKDRRSAFDRIVDAALDWMEHEATKGFPEFRRDALYFVFHIPPGSWDMDERLDTCMRRAKDRGADRTPKVELTYVYDRPPVWTIRPSTYVRDKAQSMELRRNRTAHVRLAALYPSGGKNESLATGVATMLDASVSMLSVPTAPPAKDPVITRIDARVGLAN